nr:Plug domain-containing protein [Cupriavidus campinensis]
MRTRYFSAHRHRLRYAALVTTTATATAMASAAEADDAPLLPEVSVVSQVDDAYAPALASGATRTETPLREVPQSVRVLPRALLDDIGATRLDQTFDYASGVARQNSFGGLWDNYAIRGFSGNENTGAAYLVNGFTANRGFTARAMPPPSSAWRC